ncbi:MAG TPA: ATP-dependent metallopeptidase FtsH/Yme1/Tma family protein, partial [Alphaproteobacteria bacterium]|nr:ATP-dependent metallopeptidase FtsH/Yme1/Tma family protein [Alphaproteobacteria bacterium]
MNKQQQWNVWYIVAAVMLLMLFQGLWTTYRTVEAIPYSEFRALLNEGQVVEITVEPERITGELREPINGRQYFVTNRVDPALAEQIPDGVTVTGTVQNTF